MKYFVAIGDREYEVSIIKTGTVGGQAGMSILLDGEEIAVDFWRAPGSPFVISS